VNSACRPSIHTFVGGRLALSQTGPCKWQLGRYSNVTVGKRLRELAVAGDYAQTVRSRSAAIQAAIANCRA
jgi:hypothetical protein